jgi:iron complex outermembrane receptor protein
MKKMMSLALASVSIAALASAAAAQPASQTKVTTTEPAELGEIVVTARRRSESLQEVPQVVNAVTADTLSKLDIKRFDDVQSVVPGLTLASNSTGYQAGASLRGVTFDVVSGADPTVAMYLNDAPVETNFLFQSLFDVGQIEVLRGPQGTTRGIAAPSGAITVTTHKPNVSEYGGYIDATATDQHGRNIQGAVNVPIIKDVLGVRIAALHDENDSDGVRSLNNSTRPSQKTNTVRASVSFEPSDLFNANLSYQHLDHGLNTFTQVSGPGAGYNGPAITPQDRLSVQDGINEVAQHQDYVFAQLDSRFAGQHLSYIGSYLLQKISAHSPEDIGNQIPGVELYLDLRSRQPTVTHEIRLASDAAPGKFLDYVAGVFYSRGSVTNHVSQIGAIFPTAFGTLPPNAATFDPAGVFFINPESEGATTQLSEYASLTAHFGPDTELSVGGRHIDAKSHNLLLVKFQSTILSNLPDESKDHHFIYNVSLSHHFSRDLLVYANTGSSFRVAQNQTSGVSNFEQDPDVLALQFPPPETSKSYEIGAKSTFLDGRARLNVALYHQTYKNLIYPGQPVPYVSDNGLQSVVAQNAFTAFGDAVVDGVDLDGAFQITPDWNISASASYSDGHFRNASIPCSDPNLQTLQQFQAAGKAIALCNSNGAVTRNPYWTATVTSEYVHPITEGMNGFLRGLVTYNPENTRQSQGLAVPGYSLANLYAGLRSADGAWELSLFAKNAFATKETTSRDFAAQEVGGMLPAAQYGSSGYFITAITPRREVGVNVHYAFGAR